MTNKVTLTPSQHDALVLRIADAVTHAVDALATQFELPNEIMAYSALWAGLKIAERDIGGPGVIEWLRDNADTLEAGVMARNPPDWRR